MTWCNSPGGRLDTAMQKEIALAGNTGAIEDTVFFQFENGACSAPAGTPSE